MNTKLNQILAEISAGELLDKITILEIKMEKITDSEKSIIQKKKTENIQAYNMYMKVKELKRTNT